MASASRDGRARAPHSSLIGTTAPASGSPERALTIVRTFNARRELVWKAWTDPRQVMGWWGPRDYPATHLEMDVRPGGAWRGCLTSKESGKELWQGGVFREVAPPERLVLTFAWEEEGERGLQTLVIVVFEEEDGKTRMTFHQSPFLSDEERDGHGGGWNSTFDRLDDFLAL